MAFFLLTVWRCCDIIGKKTKDKSEFNRVISKLKGRREMNKKTKLTLCTVVSAILVVVLYILFHETGHLIVMLSAGEVIDDFSILGAHVSGHGGEYTFVSDLWLNANGAVLPLIVSLVYLLFYKKDRNNTFYRMFSFFTGLVPISSLLAWVIIPFVYLNGTAPPSDDCTKFLMSFSQIANPLFVSAAALVIVVLGSILFIKKGVLRNYIYELQALKKEVTVNSDFSK